MCPLVDLDPDIFDYLKSKAEPFVDTPSTVLRRELGLTDPSAARPSRADNPPDTGTKLQGTARKTQKKKKATRTRVATGTILPEDQYEIPLLRALVDAGGTAPYRDVAEAVGRLMHDEFLPADFETLNSGGVRWQSRLQFVRLRLVERGLLERDAPRGIWAISGEGRQALEEGSQGIVSISDARRNAADGG
jgi:Mrr N-terminal domain